MMRGRLGDMKSLVSGYENADMLMYCRQNPIRLRYRGPSINNISKMCSNMWFLSMKEVQPNPTFEMLSNNPKLDMKDLVSSCYRIAGDYDDDDYYY